MNPVIKILHRMLILWKKPNDFTACLISESDEEPKSIQQNGPTLHNMGCWKKSASMWGSGQKRRKKKKEALYYKTRHWSQIFPLRSSVEFGNATECSRMQSGGYDNIQLIQAIAVRRSD